MSAHTQSPSSRVNYRGPPCHGGAAGGRLISTCTFPRARIARKKKVVRSYILRCVVYTYIGVVVHAAEIDR